MGRTWTPGHVAPLRLGFGAAMTRDITMFANPYLLCDECKMRVVGMDGLQSTGPATNLFCEHNAGVTSRCPSWSPEAGCTCAVKCAVPQIGKAGVVS